jgi:4-diphosphocytidyl-2-C-methyl-D-erythritol kinase
MIVFPNCKINLGLNIIRKRDDGFHDLETVFYPLMISDALEAVKSTVNSQQSIYSNEIAFSSTGLVIDGNPSNNLCVKAYNLLKQDFPQLPSVQMHLHKAIPMGAGLGGGSADGAFALKLLNDKFNLNLSTQQLIDYALQLGSDCPFFILNKPCFATSRGEIMNEISLDLSAYKFVIVNPGIHVNTAWAFSNITPSAPKKSIAQIIEQPVSTWKNELINDFELAVSNIHPAISSSKEQLYAAGAHYASMSGSGSTLFGIFNKESNPVLDFPPSYFIATV